MSKEKKFRAITPLVELVELEEPVPETKFDEHMKSARENTISSRKQVLISQYREANNKKERYSKIKTSIY